jgi:hypothetical protein
MPAPGRGRVKSRRVDAACVSEMRHTAKMKTATLPAIRVEPELHEKIESVLEQGETLSSFMESTLRSAVEFRSAQNEFHARGKQSQDHSDATGISYSTDEVIERLESKTQRRRKQLLGK